MDMLEEVRLMNYFLRFQFIPADKIGAGIVLNGEITYIH